MNALSDVVETTVIEQSVSRLRAVTEQRAHTLSIGGGEAVTLGFVADDYSRHQLHHLAQVWERGER